MSQILNFTKTISSLGRLALRCNTTGCLLVSLSMWFLHADCTLAQANFQDGPSKIPVEIPEEDNGFQIIFPDDVLWESPPIGKTDHTEPVVPDAPLQEPPSSVSKPFPESTPGQLLSFGTTSADLESWIGKLKRTAASSDIGRMLGSLALVLGLYFGFVWIMRRLSPSGNQNLPREVIELMGQIPFGPKRNLQLIRLGSKLLLIINSAEGSQALGEITDPNEVEYLVALCSGRKHPFQPKMRPAPKAAPVTSTPQATPTQSQTQQQNNLANILRTLDLAVNPNNSVFEA
ncbi:MAG: FliO/MopB family protein [Pirellulales bacterium]|jgi:flagellar biogenesis protein FliO